MTPEQAARYVKGGKGHDVYISTREAADKIGGRRLVKPEIHPKEGETRFQHSHPASRRGGHVFFGKGE
jgi:hypothetical protein